MAGYRIYRATTSGGYGAPLATVQGNLTTYIATGLQSGTTYFFVVTAYDTSGNESSRSNEVSKGLSLSARIRESKALAEISREGAKWVYRIAG